MFDMSSHEKCQIYLAVNPQSLISPPTRPSPTHPLPKTLTHPPFDPHPPPPFDPSPSHPLPKVLLLVWYFICLQHYLHTRTESLTPGASGYCGIKVVPHRPELPKTTQWDLGVWWGISLGGICTGAERKQLPIRHTLQLFLQFFILYKKMLIHGGKHCTFSCLSLHQLDPHHPHPLPKTLTHPPFDPHPPTLCPRYYY